MDVREVSGIVERLRGTAVALTNYDAPLRTRIMIRAGLLRESATDLRGAADLIEAADALRDAIGDFAPNFEDTHPSVAAYDALRAREESAK